MKETPIAVQVKECATRLTHAVMAFIKPVPAAIGTFAGRLWGAYSSMRVP